MTPGYGRMIHRLAKFSFSYSAGYDASFYFTDNIGFKTGLTYTHLGWGSDAEFRRYDPYVSWPRTYQTREGYVRGEVQALGVPIHFIISTGDKLGFYMEYGVNFDFVLKADRHIDYFENETFANVDVFGGSNETFSRNNFVLSSSFLGGIIYKKSNKFSYKLGFSGYYSIADFIAYEEYSNGFILGVELGVNLKVGY